jgi:hypothetical protein
MVDLVRNVYRAFSPAPLTADQQDLYVNLDDVRGEADIVGQLARRIELAEQPTCQVLAGHKGSGKSTELLRLKKQLETATPRQFVVYCKADEDVDRNDVDFPEVLIAIVRQLAHQLKKSSTEISLKPGYFKDRLERLKNLLTSEIDLSTVELDLGLASLGGAIKASPDARMEVRKLLEPDTGNWLYAANEVIGEAVVALSKKGYDGLVILVDDLDKMVVRPHETAGCMTDEHLFVNRAAQLTAFRCHVVYAIPLTLVYSHNLPTMEANYSGRVPVVPMTAVVTRPSSSKPRETGIAKFRDIIEARVDAAGARGSNVFASGAARDELIRLSGGQPSELMTLVREAIVTQGLPIDEAALERVRFNGQRDYSRQLFAHHWPIIESVRTTGSFERSSENEEAFHELLNSRAILQYRNKEEWYGLNPFVADLSPPAGSRSRSANRTGGGATARRRAKS